MTDRWTIDRHGFIDDAEHPDYESARVSRWAGIAAWEAAEELVGAANRTHTAEQTLQRIADSSAGRRCRWCRGSANGHTLTCPVTIATAALPVTAATTHADVG